MTEVADGIVANLAGLQKYARTLTHDADQADDLVQDTVVRALERQHLYRAGNLRAWLFTIMFNERINAVRRAARCVALAPDFDAPAPDTADCRVVVSDVSKTLDAMTAGMRRTILLAAGGLSYDQIIAIQGVPLGTVRSRLNRGRARLRELCG